MVLRRRKFRLFFVAIVLGILILDYVKVYPPARHILLSTSSSAQEERVSTDILRISCPEIQSYLNTEKRKLAPPLLRPPSIIDRQIHRLPYRYSQWRSSSLLPRRFTPCEHDIAMRLLTIIAQICRDHRLTFAISDGTLLGSWRHHDIIPWDDDIDLMMPIEDQISFLRALEQLKDTVVQYYLVEYPLNNLPYAKIFFQHQPFAGQHAWTFPFVDVFFYLTNETHLWYSNTPDANMYLEHVFPLVMRPLGRLWLPAPREPRSTFSFDSEKECNGHWHDHRQERRQPYITRNCSELIDVYPFVQRTRRTEVLLLNHSIIHTVIYPSWIHVQHSEKN